METWEVKVKPTNVIITSSPLEEVSPYLRFYNIYLCPSLSSLCRCLSLPPRDNQRLLQLKNKLIRSDATKLLRDSCSPGRAEVLIV